MKVRHKKIGNAEGKKVWIVVFGFGSQHFTLWGEWEDEDDAKWMAGQLRKCAFKFKESKK